ncbi:hypothetical protein ACWCXH_27410 [Kitasatospora sp. NPDC001660]
MVIPQRYGSHRGGGNRAGRTLRHPFEAYRLRSGAVLRGVMATVILRVAGRRSREEDFENGCATYGRMAVVIS